jgi:hypothetical protein
VKRRSINFCKTGSTASRSDSTPDTPIAPGRPLTIKRTNVCDYCGQPINKMGDAAGDRHSEYLSAQRSERQSIFVKCRVKHCTMSYRTVGELRYAFAKNRSWLLLTDYHARHHNGTPVEIGGHSRSRHCLHSGCGWSFKDHRSLKRHDETVHATKNIWHCKSPGCSDKKGFARHDNLLKHVRRHHSRTSRLVSLNSINCMTKAMGSVTRDDHWLHTTLMRSPIAK